MKLDHSTIVLGMDGRPMLDQSEEPLSFRTVAMVALGTPDPKIPAEKKAAIFALMVKFHKGRFVYLTLDDATLLKERAGASLTAIGYGRLAEWLEGEPQFVGTDVDEPEPDELSSNGKEPSATATS